jgi:hypothetical protein
MAITLPRGNGEGANKLMLHVARLLTNLGMCGTLEGSQCRGKGGRRHIHWRIGVSCGLFSHPFLTAALRPVRLSAKINETKRFLY